MQSRITSSFLIALCALLLGALLWQARSNGAEKNRLADRIAVLSQQLASATPKSVAVIAAPAPASHPSHAPPATQAPPRPASNHLPAGSLVKLSEDLAAARARISELESKTLSLEADRATLTQQRQQDLTASEESCRARSVDIQRALEAAQSDLKTVQQRAVLFESENANLRKAQSLAAKTTRATDLSAELDELARRRDASLKSLLRRFREIDTEYRALLRDPQSGHANDPAAFRIQSMLAQAEDDLRQIDSLSAKTLLVEKKREKN